jgi:hypothetical protein
MLPTNGLSADLRAMVPSVSSATRTLGELRKPSAS